MDRGRMDNEERRYTTLVWQALTRWLRRALDAVLAAYRMFGTAPDPHAVYSRSEEWISIVDRELLPELRTAHEIGWSSVLPGVPLVSTDTFIQAQIAQTRNLLVRIPDEVYNLIFAEISDAVNDGDPLRDIAARVDRALSDTGSENWQNRAKVIAVTEVNRAGSAAALAAGYQAERIEGVPMIKKWIDSDDRRVRPAHHRADGQERPLSQPFDVGGDLIMYPGDPTGLPETVINCRCSIQIRAAR
jgi:hypothetical protein